MNSTFFFFSRTLYSVADAIARAKNKKKRRKIEDEKRVQVSLRVHVLHSFTDICALHFYYSSATIVDLNVIICGSYFI